MEERGLRDHTWKRVRIFAGLVVLAFAIALAIVIGNRLSDQALAVLAGAVCGVGAAIPTSLLIVAVSRRRDEPRAQPSMPQGAYPPVVVVTPPGGQQRGSGWDMVSPSLAPPVNRQFTVVGAASTDTEVIRDERYS